MNKGRYSPERLFRIRRLREARRLFKKQPLFAFDLMQAKYPDYTYPDFLDDLRRRSPPKRKKKKNPLFKYGRFPRMENLLFLYAETRDIECARKATQLRKYMTRPYRVRVTINCTHIEYTFSPLVPIEKIENLVQRLNSCKDESAADDIVKQFRETSHIS